MREDLTEDVSSLQTVSQEQSPPQITLEQFLNSAIDRVKIFWHNSFNFTATVTPQALILFEPGAARGICVVTNH